MKITKRQVEEILDLAEQKRLLEVALLMREYGATSTDLEKANILSEAIHGYGSVTCIETLLDVGLSLDTCTKSKEPVISRIARVMSEGALMQLVKRVNNLDAKNLTGETALMKCVEINSTMKACILLEHGANINAKRDDGYTALHLAAMYDDYAMVLYLMQCGADMEATNDKGQTAEDVANNFMRYSSMRAFETMRSDKSRITHLS